MFSRTKAVYLIGSLILGLLTISIVFVGLIAGGVINVVRTELVLTAGSAEKYYDGKELVCDSWSLTYGALQEGHTMDVVVTGSQVDAGTGVNYVYATIYDENGVDVTEDYSITYQYGELKVDPRIITIVGGSATKTYDGTALTSSEYTIRGTTIGDDTLQVSTSGSQIDAGTGSNMPTATVVDKNGEDANKNYQLVYQAGDLVVNPVPVTFSSISAKKTYDATELNTFAEPNSVWLSFGSLLSGHDYTYLTTGSLTNAGATDNTFDITIYDSNNDNKDVTKNYDIEYNTGTLTVEPERLVLYTESQTWEYDALSHKNNNYTVEALATISRFSLSFEVTWLNEITNAGEIDNDVNLAIINADLEDVTNNFKVEKNLGKLTVTKKKLVIPTDSASQEYNAKTLTSTNLSQSAVQNQIIDGQTFKAYVNGSQTNAGTSNNTVYVAITDAEGNVVTDNYEIDASALGTLKVDPIYLTLTALTKSKDYDGTPLTANDNVIYNASTLVEGQTLLMDQIVIDGTITNAGTVVNAINRDSVKIVDAFGNDVTENYFLNCVDGTLTVNQVKLTFTSDSGTKEYDGTSYSLDDSTFRQTSGKLIDGQTYVIEDKLVLTEATGQEEMNTFTVKVYDGNNEDVSGNYDITYLNGVLIYNPKSVTFKSISSHKVYDGTELTTSTTDGAVAISNGQLVEGHTFSVSSQTILYTCGTSANDFTITIFDADGKKVASTEDADVKNYQIIKDKGTLNLEKRAYSISSKNLTKQYDGTALCATSDSYTAIGELATDDTLVVTFTEAALAGITNKGSIANEFTFSIKNSKNEEISASCYDVDVTMGTIEITPCELTITSGSDTKEYDGTPLTSSKIAITSGAKPSIADITMTASGTITNAGTQSNTITYTIKEDSTVVASDTITNQNYEITLVEGDLVVTKKLITVSTGSQSKDYDGVELTYNSTSVVGLISGHTVHTYPTNNTSITYVGTVDNAVEDDIVIYDADDNDVTSNYECGYSLGKLTITKKYIQIAAKSINGTSDEYSVPCSCNEITYDSSKLSAKDEISYWVVDGTCKLYNVSALNQLVSVTITRKADKTDAGKDVTNQYDIEYLNGAIYISSEVSSTSVSIGKPSNDTTSVALKVYAANAGSIYLKWQNTGDYTGNGFAAADAYGYYKTESTSGIATANLIGGEGGYSASYLTSLILSKTTGISSYKVTVEPQNSVGYCPLPLYTVMGTTAKADSADYYISSDTYSLYTDEGSVDFTNGYGVQTNDSANTIYYKKALEIASTSYNIYSFSTYLFDYLTNDKTLGTLTGTDLTFYNAYKTYVEGEYLQIPTSTKTYIDTIISAKGWSSLSTKEKVQVVKTYLTNTSNFTYCLDYDEAVDSQEDVVVAFLGLYKTGICQHFAAAATMIYRALGIPARYCTGYRADVANANTWTDVKMSQGHAWVEVFIDGIGWVVVDTTPSTTGDSNKSTVTDIYELTVRPADVAVDVSASTTATPSTYIGLTDFFAKHSEYKIGTVTFGGSQTGVGSSTSYISLLTILDATDNTELYRYEALSEGVGAETLDKIGLDITYKTGTLTVYNTAITITTSSISKTYDGTELTCWEFTYGGETYTADEDGYTYLSGVATPIVIEGTTAIKVLFTKSRTKVGSSNNSVTISFYDTSTGNSVDGSSYNQNITIGKLIITKRAIVVDATNKTISGDGIADGEEFDWSTFALDDDGNLSTWNVRNILSETSTKGNYTCSLKEE